MFGSRSQHWRETGEYVTNINSCPAARGTALVVDAVAEFGKRFIDPPQSARAPEMHCATLRRTLNNAKDDILIFDAPDFTLFKEKGRSLRLNEEAERRLLQVADQPLKEIVVVMRGTGMRNAREYRILVEDIDFDAGSIIVPDSKTARRRFHLTRRLQSTNPGVSFWGTSLCKRRSGTWVVSSDSATR